MAARTGTLAGDSGFSPSAAGMGHNGGPPLDIRPQPGPQLSLVLCPHDDVFFGGARGGGKTYGMLLAWIKHAQTYGRYATGVFFRKVFKNLEEVIAEAHRIFPHFGGKYEKSSQTYVFRSGSCAGARLKFRHLALDSDADSYQGHAYCVGIGTPVLMASGGYKPIEQIEIGELVMTLEGARPVTGRVAPYLAPCVRATVRDVAARVVGSQIHPIWHPVLSDGDWRASSGGGRSDRTTSGDDTRGVEQPLQSFFPATLHEPAVRSALSRQRPFHGEAIRSNFPEGSAPASSETEPMSSARGSGQPRPGAPRQSDQGRAARLASSARAYARHELRTAAGSEDRYLIDSDCGGALVLRTSGTCQGAVPSRADAEAPHHVERLGGSGTIPTRIRHPRGTYPHPYTGEERDLAEAVVQGSVQFEPCGDAFVADLTVEGANHYITACGLINQNTWICFEEMTQWATPTAIDMLKGTLRSGHGVKCVFRATGNPGGAGHNWVKARYQIGSYPRGFQRIVDPETDEVSVFIPSKLEDNAILTTSDPNYEKRLRRVGTPALIKAWRFGNWNIVAGGFFDDLWAEDKHVLKPFDLPPSWRLMRSFDWGSSKPFSLGMWAISDGTQPRVPGRRLPYFPAGSFIRFGEWYGAAQDANGATKPNVGLRMVNVAMGQEIAERTGRFTWEGDVADPAIFTENGGESVYEQLQKGARSKAHVLSWSPADNSRVAGWQRFRSILEASATDDMESPGLWVFDTCVDFIRTVPVLQAAKLKPDDVDSDGEDHIGDETRYAIMSGSGGAAFGTARVLGR